MSDTRDYIIDQAFSLFLSKSYEAVSISDISKAIGFTKGALYHHFTNKEELFKAVIDKYLVFTEIETDLENTTLEQYNVLIIKNAEKILHNLFGNVTEVIPIDYLSLITDGFRHYAGFAEKMKQFLCTETDKVKQILDNSIKRSEIRGNINTSVIAATYFSSSMGLAGNLLHNNSVELTLKTLKAQLDELYKLLKV
jgi:AcrR family transcriptional regulator